MRTDRIALVLYLGIQQPGTTTCTYLYRYQFWNTLRRIVRIVTFWSVKKKKSVLFFFLSPIVSTSLPSVRNVKFARLQLQSASLLLLFFF